MTVDPREAHAELERLNEQYGLRKRGGPEQPPATEASEAQVPVPEETGPPRFTGVDLDAGYAIVNKSTAIPLAKDQIDSIVGILLIALRMHLDHTFDIVKSVHEGKDPRQLELDLQGGGNGEPEA